MSRMGVCYSYPNCVSSFPFHCTMRKVKPFRKANRGAPTLSNERNKGEGREAPRDFILDFTFHPLVIFRLLAAFLHIYLLPLGVRTLQLTDIQNRVDLGQISVTRRSSRIANVFLIGSRIYEIKPGKSVEFPRFSTREFTTLADSLKKLSSVNLKKRSELSPSTYASTPQFLSVPFLHILLCHVSLCLLTLAAEHRDHHPRAPPILAEPPPRDRDGPSLCRSSPWIITIVLCQVNAFYFLFSFQI